MTLVHASSTPSTISVRCFSEKGWRDKNLRTKFRINARFAVWLVNSSFPLFIGPLKREHSSALNQVPIRNQLDIARKRLFSLAHVENACRAGAFGHARFGPGTRYCLRRASCRRHSPQSRRG